MVLGKLLFAVFLSFLVIANSVQASTFGDLFGSLFGNSGCGDRCKEMGYGFGKCFFDAENNDEDGAPLYYCDGSNCYYQREYIGGWGDYCENDVPYCACYYKKDCENCDENCGYNGCYECKLQRVECEESDGIIKITGKTTGCEGEYLSSCGTYKEGFSTCKYDNNDNNMDLIDKSKEIDSSGYVYATYKCNEEHDGDTTYLRLQIRKYDGTPLTDYKACNEICNIPESNECHLELDQPDSVGGSGEGTISIKGIAVNCKNGKIICVPEKGDSDIIELVAVSPANNDIIKLKQDFSCEFTCKKEGWSNVEVKIRDFEGNIITENLLVRCVKMNSPGCWNDEKCLWNPEKLTNNQCEKECGETANKNSECHDKSCKLECNYNDGTKRDGVCYEECGALKEYDGEIVGKIYSYKELFGEKISDICYTNYWIDFNNNNIFDTTDNQNREDVKIELKLCKEKNLNFIKRWYGFPSKKYPNNCPEECKNERKCDTKECDDSKLPSFFDWRSTTLKDGNEEIKGNWMTPVKNQGGAGVCWAFAVVGAIEAKYNIEKLDPTLNLDLSEQELVSCKGQKKFVTSDALLYSRQNGLVTEQCFPYVTGERCEKREDGSYDCYIPPCSDKCGGSEIYKINKFNSNPPPDICSLKKQLIYGGPVIISVDVSKGHFEHDIYYSGSSTNHAAVLVGYNDENKYWIMKNSWGSDSDFGEGGYFKYSYYSTIDGIHSITKATVANPAAEYCVKMGYEYNIIKDSEGNERGICKLPDGNEVSEWDFFEGRAGYQYSYCVQNGYELEIMTDGQNSFSPHYAVCVDEEGTETAITDIMGIGEESVDSEDKVILTPQLITQSKIESGLSSSVQMINCDSGIIILVNKENEPLNEPLIFDQDINSFKAETEGIIRVIAICFGPEVKLFRENVIVE